MILKKCSSEDVYNFIEIFKSIPIGAAIHGDSPENINASTYKKSVIKNGKKLILNL